MTPSEKRRDGTSTRARWSQALHRRSSANADGPPRDPDATLPIEPVLRQLVSELRDERTEVLDPLLHRLVELGDRLIRGDNVGVETVDRAIQLIDDYLRTLHNVHVRQFAEAGISDLHPEVCSLPIVLIEQEPERAERRLASVRAMLGGYRARFPGYHEMLGRDLRNESLAELSWEGFSEDYAKTCLPTHLTPKAMSDWRRSLEDAHEDFQRLRLEVREFLSDTEGLVAPASAPPAPGVAH
jgi:hypothetical protein